MLRDVDVDSSNVPPAPPQSVKLQVAEHFTAKPQHVYHESIPSSEEDDQHLNVNRRSPKLVPYYLDNGMFTSISISKQY